MPREATTNASQSWDVDKFAVHFVAGPKSERDERPFSHSFYRVTRKFESYKVHSNLGIESAMDVQYFQWTPAAKPSDFIKVFVSRSGRTLLIEENVPNDCGPCWNHVLVVADADSMEYEYLDLPARVTGCREVFGQEPKVTGISDTQVSYRYEDGTTVSEDLKRRVKGDKRPNYPG